MIQQYNGVLGEIGSPTLETNNDLNRYSSIDITKQIVCKNIRIKHGKVTLRAKIRDDLFKEYGLDSSKLYKFRIRAMSAYGDIVRLIGFDLICQLE